MIQRRIWTLAILVIATAACKIHKPISTPLVVSDELKEVYYEAEAAYQAGNLAEARTLFVDFAKKSPLPAAGYHRLACIERKESHYSEALVLIEKAQTADTGNYYYNLFEAEIQVKVRQYVKAADIYQKLAIKYPSHWSFFSDAAKNYRNGSAMAQLIVLCTHWEKAFGLREEIANYRCEAHFQLAQYDECLNTWHRLMQKYPYRKQYSLTYATWFSRVGKSDEAAKIYQDLLTEDPNNPELLSALCDYYQNTSNMDALWEHAKKVAKSTQMDVWKKHSCFIPFLNNLQSNKYYDSLEELLQTLVKVHPTDHRSWLFLADWYFARKNYQKAINGFSSSLQLFNNDFQVWAKYTECLDRTAAYDRLAKVGDSMVEIFPSNPTVELIAAKGYMGIGNWKLATEHCENGLVYAVDEDIVVALKSSLARILNSQGNKNKAYTLLNELIAMYPQNAEVMNELAYMYAMNKEQESKAQEWIDKALARNNAPGYLYTKGYIAFQFSRFADATESLKAAIKLDPQGKFLELLGDAFSLKGDAAEAQRQWQLAWDAGYRSSSLLTKRTKAKPQ